MRTLMPPLPRLLPLAACAALLSACKATDARQGAGATAAGGAGTAAAVRADSGARRPMNAVAAKALDSGNVLLRAKKDRDALAQYRVAAAEAPDHAAPWFGIGMAAKRLGDSALVDSAKRIISARSPNPGMQSIGAAVPGHGAPNPHAGIGRGAGATDPARPPGHPAPASPHGASTSTSAPPTPKGDAPR